METFVIDASSSVFIFQTLKSILSGNKIVLINFHFFSKLDRKPVKNACGSDRGIGFSFQDPYESL